MTPRAVEDLVNGKGQIKELTFDIFAVLSSEQSAMPSYNNLSDNPALNHGESNKKDPRSISSSNADTNSLDLVENKSAGGSSLSNSDDGGEQEDEGEVNSSVKTPKEQEMIQDLD